MPWTGDHVSKPKQADFKAWVDNTCSTSIAGQTHQHRREERHETMDRECRRNIAREFSGRSARVDCDGVPAGPARTDCYIGLSRVYRGQTDIAAGKARVQSDAARLQQVTGTTGRPRTLEHRRNRPVTVGPE
jgi:hypothetical protein